MSLRVPLFVAALACGSLLPGGVGCGAPGDGDAGGAPLDEDAGSDAPDDGGGTPLDGGGDGGPPRDGGNAGGDGGGTASDAGSDDEDAGSSDDDAGSGDDDAGSGDDDAGSGDDDAGSGEGDAGGGAADAGGGEGDAGGTDAGTADAGVDAGQACDDVDHDGDGFSACAGDCCDTVEACADPAQVGPSAVEVQTPADAGAPFDEDCDSFVDEVDPPCDDGLLLASTDPTEAAQALGVCTLADADGGTAPGLMQARYTRADGTTIAATLQMGLQPSFGSNVFPQAGAAMTMLSTGHARALGQTGACGDRTCASNEDGTPPSGFPQDVPSCPATTSIHDDVALELTLRAPQNARGFRFAFRFYSFEYPDFQCNEFNDQLVVLMDPAPAGAPNGNVAFDSLGNPVSVNIGFFDVCTGCAAGTADLTGTGFDAWNVGADNIGAGATSWLVTQAPVAPRQEFTLRFILWDGGDQGYDSSVLLDDFRWLADTTIVGTDPG